MSSRITLLKTIRTAAIVVSSIVQLFATVLAQVPTKPVREISLYAFTWPGGYSEIDFENFMSAGIVTNIDPSILGPELSIDAPEATYHLTVSVIKVSAPVQATLKSYGLVGLSGFDIRWPQGLPPLNGETNYVAISEQRLQGPNAVSLRALSLLHTFYQTHQSELAAAARARASATPSPTPDPAAPPVTVIRVQYPAQSPTPH